MKNPSERWRHELFFIFQSVFSIPNKYIKTLLIYSHVILTQKNPLSVRKILKSPGAEILSKRTVSAEFRGICLKLCGNCALPQNFHLKKLGEITVFYVVFALERASDKDNDR